MHVDEIFLVQFILNSLPSQFGVFKIHYNNNEDKWSLNELTNMRVQKEMKLREEGRQTALPVTHGAIKKKKGKFVKSKKNPPKKKNEPGKENQVHNGFTVRCYFVARREM